MYRVLMSLLTEEALIFPLNACNGTTTENGNGNLNKNE